MSTTRTTTQTVADQLRHTAIQIGTSSPRAQMLLAAAGQLDPIGRCSESYPWLALARDWSADYGDVLWFVDYLTNPASQLPRDDPRFTQALERLSHEQRKAILGRIHELRLATVVFKTGESE